MSDIWFPFTDHTREDVDWSQPPCLCHCHHTSARHIMACCNLPPSSIYLDANNKVLPEKLEEVRQAWEKPVSDCPNCQTAQIGKALGCGSCDFISTDLNEKDCTACNKALLKIKYCYSCKTEVPFF